MRRIWLTGAFVSVATMAWAVERPLPPAEVDWRDQILYFAMIDRFDDGDPSNNDQGAGVFDPTDPSKYSGGDLAGLTRRLDYLAGLGVTGLWITPPVASQWWDGEVGYAGYHGYWARDFMAVDEHYGTLEDYRALARGLHARGMSLVQDIVVNHTGNFFTYEDWREGEPAAGWRRNRDSRPSDRPDAFPWSMNDPRDPAQHALGVFHWTPPVRDYGDRTQELRFQMSGLDDLATGNPLVRRELRRAYGYWIREVGVDAFRVDTAFYVEPEFFTEFLHADDPEAPGILRVAAAAGKPRFHVFGEGFAIDRPYEDTQMRRIDAYQRIAGGIPAMIQFPLYATLGDVFARGHAPAELAWRIERTLALHADPWRMPSFLDNHDVDRFLSGGDEAGLRQALLALLSLPGIPVLWQGTEQGFRTPRGAMFARGVGSGGRDHFDTGSPLYREIAALTALRRAHPVLSRGRPTVHAATSAGPGTLAWSMHGDAEAEARGEPSAHQAVLVALNTAADTRLLHATGLPPRTRLRPLHAVAGAAPEASVGIDGRLLLSMPGRAGWAWAIEAVAASPAPDHEPPPLRIDPPTPNPARGRLRLHGTAPPGTAGSLRLVVDGELGSALPVTPEASGRWEAPLALDGFLDPGIEHELLLIDLEEWRASPAVRFRVQPDWRLLTTATDPAGDDTGPERRYRYPTDPSFAGTRSLDFLEGRLYGNGGALAIELELAGLPASWNPGHGFDHLALSIFIELPWESGGAEALPFQNARLPGGGRWHRRLRVSGWSNALFHHEGAGPEADGRPMAPAARLQVDREARRIRLELPASALGSPPSLAGLRVVALSWDYDGGWRRLSPEGGPFQFGGGDGDRDPLWMDALELRVPPPQPD